MLLEDENGGRCPGGGAAVEVGQWKKWPWLPLAGGYGDERVRARQHFCTWSWDSRVAARARSAGVPSWAASWLYRLGVAEFSTGWV